MHSKEQYTLVWESKHLKRLGNAFEYILNGLMSMAATEALKYTVLAGKCLFHAMQLLWIKTGYCYTSSK